MFIMWIGSWNNSYIIMKENKKSEKKTFVYISNSIDEIFTLLKLNFLINFMKLFKSECVLNEKTNAF